MCVCVCVCDRGEENHLSDTNFKDFDFPPEVYVCLTPVTLLVHKSVPVTPNSNPNPLSTT